MIHISEPIKLEYSKLNKINFDKLMMASEYKEKYRQDMVRWSEAEKLNRNDHNYFLKLALQMSFVNDDKPIWMIVDARRLPDVQYFYTSEFDSVEIITVRINASEEIRKKRGWSFVSGIDDAQTECGLDEYTNWSYFLTNNGDEVQLMSTLNEMLNQVLKVI